MNDRPQPYRIFCLGGCPGAGKSTVRQELCRRHPTDVVFLSRVTTRPLRPGEDGEAIHIPWDAMVAESLASRLTARDAAHGALYAISLAELERRIRGPQQWIGCISVNAGFGIQACGYPVTFIYLTVRDRARLLRRLQDRGLSEGQIAARMHEFDYEDPGWRDLSTPPEQVFYTDELTIPVTVEAVERMLDLPTLKALTAS